MLFLKGGEGQKEQYNVLLQGNWGVRMIFCLARLCQDLGRSTDRLLNRLLYNEPG